MTVIVFLDIVADSNSRKGQGYFQYNVHLREKETAPLALVLTGTCVSIHPRWVELASPIELTTSRTEASQTQRFCVSSLETFTQSFRFRA